MEKEVHFYESNDLISREQKDTILNLYEVKNRLNFIRVIVTIGAILVGLGVLSFIAGNWDGMSKLLKLAIIFGLFVGINCFSFRLLDRYPKTGRSLIYLGALVYGAGIFLIGQMFNFGGDFATAFLLWSLGITPMAIQQKDKYLLLFANILFAVYLNMSYHGAFPYLALLGIPALYYAFHFFQRSGLLLFFANLTTLNFILFLAIRYEVEGFYTALTFLFIGLLMYFLRHSLQPKIFKFQGNVVFGVAGIALTFASLWHELIPTYDVLASTIFAIAFLVLLFALIRKGSLTSLILVCLTIFRYYVDTFQFLPKSIFFVVGGLILLGFGYYFERLRKTQKGGIEQ
jgi:uncharacterized membrane protein